VHAAALLQEHRNQPRKRRRSRPGPQRSSRPLRAEDLERPQAPAPAAEASREARRSIEPVPAEHVRAEAGLLQGAEQRLGRRRPGGEESAEVLQRGDPGEFERRGPVELIREEQVQEVQQVPAETQTARRAQADTHLCSAAHHHAAPHLWPASDCAAAGLLRRQLEHPDDLQHARLDLAHQARGRTLPGLAESRPVESARQVDPRRAEPQDHREPDRQQVRAASEPKRHLDLAEEAAKESELRRRDLERQLEGVASSRDSDSPAAQRCE